MKKIITSLLIIAVLLGNSSALVFAEDVATPTPDAVQAQPTPAIQWPDKAEKPEKEKA